MPRESNILQIWGNKDSMNLNSMILTNIQSSMYFKKELYELKTYHEVIDEIFYRVKHLEPWEKGSRKTQGLTGMCGGVRGVGGGGIVSTAFCILYKLYTLKLTRKQVTGLMVHQDSPYIRGLGFMYVRYTQAPPDLFDWYEPYLDDTEEIDVKAGGGYVMTIGNMLKHWLTRLEWFETLFPRIPVPIQNEIMFRLNKKYGGRALEGVFDDESGVNGANSRASKRTPPPEISEAVRQSSRSRSRSRSPRAAKSRSRSRSKSNEIKSKKHHRHHHHKHHHRKHHRRHSNDKARSRSKSHDNDNNGGDGEHKHRHRSHHKHRHHRRHKHESSSNGKDHKSRSRSRSEVKRKRSKSDED